MAGLQLLAGETTFGPEIRSGTEIREAQIREAQIREARQAALAKLLPTREAKKAAFLLPSLRGLRHTISRSDLERFCNFDVGEAPPLPPPVAFAPAPTLARKKTPTAVLS
jgi:hypothetical protein